MDAVVNGNVNKKSAEIKTDAQTKYNALKSDIQTIKNYVDSQAENAYVHYSTVTSLVGDTDHTPEDVTQLSISGRGELRYFWKDVSWMELYIDGRLFDSDYTGVGSIPFQSSLAIKAHNGMSSATYETHKAIYIVY
jgi:hypothetical protein